MPHLVVTGMPNLENVQIGTIGLVELPCQTIVTCDESSPNKEDNPEWHKPTLS